MSLLRSASKLIFSAIDLVLPRLPGPRLLIYHQVGAGLGRQMEVTVEDFDTQLAWLAQNRQVVGLEEAVERWHEPESSNLVVLTFDDGYEDTYRVAYPRLRDHGMPFTLYLTTAPLESGDALGPLPEAAPISWDQMEEMARSKLMTVGAHTHTHRDLRHMDEDAIAEELSTSDELIATRMGIEPMHFAYPWGYWSEAADRVVRRRYRTAVLGSPRIKAEATPSPHRLHRFPVQLSDGTSWFGPRLRGGLRAEEELRRRLRGYDGP